MSDVRWQWCRFDELGLRALHDLLRLRQDVFIVEQDCVFHEIDGRDPDAWHLLAWRDDDGARTLVASARVFEPGALAAEPVIGRVVTAGSVRGTGLGRRLMEEAMRRTAALAPEQPMRVAAQARLVDFYRSLGFEPVGEEYLEDGIVHVDMVKP